jgi:dUTPase
VDDRLTEMFQIQEALEREKYNAVPASMRREELIDYIKHLILHLITEAVEALDETAWKPHNRFDVGPVINLDNYINELVDVWHLFMSALLATGYTPEEAASMLYVRYTIKNQRNRERPLLLLCPGCRRRISDSTVKCHRITNTTNMYKCEITGLKHILSRKIEDVASPLTT